LCSASLVDGVTVVESKQTGRKVVGSTPNEVIGFFNLPNPSSCFMALGSTQSLEEMSTRNLRGGIKRGRLLTLTTSSPSMGRFSRKCGEPRHLATIWDLQPVER
jgi:hypothetical protein